MNYKIRKSKFSDCKKSLSTESDFVGINRGFSRLIIQSIFSLLFFCSVPFISYADMSTGLMGYWNFDDGTVNDQSGNGKNGTITGATSAMGKIGNALSFNGTSDYVSIPLMNYDEISISAWFYKNSNDTTNADSIFGGYYWNPDTALREGYDLRFYNTTPDKIDFMLVTKDGSGAKTLKTAYYNMSSSVGAWYHFVGTYNKTTGEQKLYVDGSLRNTQTHLAGNVVVPLTAYPDTRIGYSRLNTGYFNGVIDDVRIYNRELSASDVSEIYNYTGVTSGSSSSAVIVYSPPSITDISVAGINQTSAILNSTVNNNGLSTTVYFEYGLSVTSFGNTTSSLTVDNSGDTVVSSSISNLSPSTLYYYRVVAQSSAGITYGAAQSFTTLSQTDFSPPSGSVSINFNSATTNSPKVNLTLSATDNIKASHYYASETNSTPSVNDSNWKQTIATSTGYYDNRIFYLSSGDGVKTVYVWYKDLNNNVSGVSSDSITLNKDDSWKNSFTVIWSGSGAQTINDKIKFAKQVGYDYIALRPGDSNGNKSRYKNNTEKNGLKFYIINPLELQTMIPVVTTTDFDTTKTYTQEQKDFYNNYFVWKSNDQFPNNFATGWFTNSGQSFRVLWDIQRQSVIDYLVPQIVQMIKSYEDKAVDFTFGGWMVDEPQLTGDFNYWDGTKNNKTTLAYWTGLDSGFQHDGTVYDYSTYSEAKVAFYKQLNTALRQEWSDFKSIAEPFYLYKENPPSIAHDWLNGIKNRSDKNEIVFDFLYQENAGTEFVDDNNIFNSGMNITKDVVGSSQAFKVEEELNRLYATKAAINGSWYNWFGIWGNRGTSPNFLTLQDVYPRLKMIRLIPSWDNLNNIPLANRSWNNSNTNPIYNSYDTNNKQQSYIDGNVMYSRQPKTGKIFAVLTATGGTIKLKPGENISSIQCVDGLFVESGDCSSDFTVTDTANGKQLALKSSVVVPVDYTNSQVKGIGYVIVVSSGSSSNSSSSSTISGSSSSASSLSVSSSSVSSSSFSANTSSASISGVGGGVNPNENSSGTTSVAVSNQLNSGLSNLLNQTSGQSTSDYSKNQTSQNQSTYYFIKKLGYGSRGTDVTELQKRLKSEGVYGGPITGFYGLMTVDAVKKYQNKNGLPRLGYVGPKTISILNGALSKNVSSTPTTSTLQNFSLKSILELFISFGIISSEKASIARAMLKTMEMK